MSESGRYYPFRFSNKEYKIFRTRGEAEIYAAKHDLEIIYDGIKFIKDNLPTARNDRFISGYQPHLGKFVSTKREYKRIIRERGLVEVGNESLGRIEKKRDGLDISDLKELSKEGVSDRAIDSIKDI